MRTIIAGPKPSYNDWIKYIYKEVKKEIIEWPKIKIKTQQELELEKLYILRKNNF